MTWVPKSARLIQEDETQREGISPIGAIGGILGGAGGFVAGGPIGAGLGATVGYGAGAVSQEMLQDLLGKQQEQPKEQLEKVLPQAGVAGGIGLTAGAGVAGLQELQKFFKTGGLQGIRTQRAIEDGLKGIKIQGDKIAKAAERAAEKAPTSYRQSAIRLAKEASNKFSGKNISPLDAVEEKAASWEAGYSATRASKGAAAYMERAIGSEIRRQIGELSPKVAQIDKIYSTLFKGQKIAKAGIWNALKISALGRFLGLGGG